MSGIQVSWVKNSMDDIHGLSHPRWDDIYQHLDNQGISQNDHALWHRIANQWLECLQRDLNASYRIESSAHFLLLTQSSKRHCKLFLTFCERMRQRVLRLLEGVAKEDGFCPFVILMFDHTDHYYHYIAGFNDTGGTYGQSAGTFIQRGYGHIALNSGELNVLEIVTAHELTHALVQHLPIPLWLDEGMAVLMEGTISGDSRIMMTAEQHQTHIDFWNAQTIQEFWHGSSFFRPDEGQGLSYQLAALLVHSLTQDFDTFVAFANAASYQDGGEQAANEIAGGSLSHLITHFFGDGDWTPKPLIWNSFKEPLQNSPYPAIIATSQI